MTSYDAVVIGTGQAGPSLAQEKGPIQVLTTCIVGAIPILVGAHSGGSLVAYQFLAGSAWLEPLFSIDLATTISSLAADEATLCVGTDRGIVVLDLPVPPQEAAILR